MGILYKHRKIPCWKFILTITLICWLLGAGPLVYSQDQNNVPTIKVKREKPKKPVKIRPERGKKIKDDYKQPRTKSTPEAARDTYKKPRSRKKSGEIKDNYRRPASKSKGEKVKISDAKELASPPAEEGVKTLKIPFWKKLLLRNAPSTHQGDIRIKKNAEGNTGTIYMGQKNKKTDFESLSKDIHSYEGGLKTRQAKQKASRAAMFEGKIKRSPSRRKVKRYQQIAKLTGNYQGNMKVSNRQDRMTRKNAVSVSNSYGPVTFKRRSRKAEIRHSQKKNNQVGNYEGQIKITKKKEADQDYSFHRGCIKVRTVRNQTRHFKKLSDEIHQFNGMLRVRKPGKDMHPSVSYLKSKTKNSYEKKEKYRKWKLKWHRWFKSKDQPKHLKAKDRKPRYDHKESEIWYY